ncbi:MAG: GIY-YIG nuclease family protein [Rhodospirillales bacterium]|jgi:putative endonuclease|nr:GIY-YIG nuclease family protein [Rhodospirillales bacterium]
MSAFVYIVRCSDGSYYVGSARMGLELRIAEHNAGTYGGYTAKRRPVALVYSQEFERVEDCIAVERQLKGWSRAKKEALIHGDVVKLMVLAKRQGEKRPNGAGLKRNVKNNALSGRTDAQN